MSPMELGWIIVDSLDSLMIMNLTARLSEARRWVSRHLDYNQDQDVNTFETTIRMFGGLLSAHHLAAIMPGASSKRDHVYLNRSIDLAQRLLGAHQSPSGVPHSSIHLGKGRGISSHNNAGASSLAEVSTLQLEMTYLSNLTGNPIYWQKAGKAMQVLDDHQIPDGLLPIYIHPDNGKFMGEEIRVGSRGDSYYGHVTGSSISLWDLINRCYAYFIHPRHHQDYPIVRAGNCAILLHTPNSFEKVMASRQRRDMGEKTSSRTNIDTLL
ncbi:hypothetical protein R6Q59_010196 [Mikania micrantha]